MFKSYSAHLYTHGLSLVAAILVLFSADPLLLEALRRTVLGGVTDFNVERVTAHNIKINDPSCFNSRWPNSKTKQNVKHL